jgi:DNA-binding IclR family transcriptional regulator
MNLHKVALTPMRDLSAQTQETINITVLDGGECVNIGSISSPKSIQHVGRLGRRTPLHCTATGKVLLAFISAEERGALVSSTLQPCTEKSIVDHQKLNQTLDQVRERGYAIAHEEYEEGLSAIAAPIRDHTSRVVAAVSISGPTYRMGSDRIDKILEPLKDTAANISTQLGYVPSNR